MKNIRPLKRRIYPFMTVLILAGLTSCSQSMKGYTFYPLWQTGFALRTSSRSFDWKDLALGDPLGVEDRLWLSTTGDVTGGPEKEIIITHNRGIDFLSQNGELLNQWKDPGFIVESLLIHDVDGDGKGDILAGKQLAPQTGYSIINGSGELLGDTNFTEASQAATSLRFIRDNILYLQSCTKYRVAPKITAAVDLTSGNPLFIHHSPSLPLGLSMGIEGILALSSRAVHREGKAIPYPYEGEVDQPAIMMINPQDLTAVGGDRNELALYRPLGGKVHSMDPQSNPITEISSKLIDLNEDGLSETINLINCESGWIRGNLSMDIRDRQGEILHKWTGPEEERGDFIFYRNNNKKIRILLTLERSGRILLFDQELNILQDRVIFPDRVFHMLNFYAHGDINSDKNLDFIFADGGTLAVLDESLKLTGKLILPSHIEDIHVLSDTRDGAVLMVQAGDLYPIMSDRKAAETQREEQKKRDSAILQAFVEPEIDENRPFNLYYDSSRPPLQFSRSLDNLEPELKKVLFEDEYTVCYVSTDISGDDKEEHLASQIYKMKIAVLNSDYEIIRYIDSPHMKNYPQFPLWAYLWPVPDITGDGKAELTSLEYGDIHATIMSGEGQLLQSSLYITGLDSQAIMGGVKNSVIHFLVRTGYQFSPRGIMTYDLVKRKFLTYNPTATMVGLGPNNYFQGDYYYSSFTTSNGYTQQHSNGFLESDDVYYFHTSTEGDYSPVRSRPYPQATDNRGRLFNYVLNLALDGSEKQEETLIFATSRMKEYYPGPFELFTYDFDTDTKTVHFRGPDKGELFNLTQTLYEGDSVYALSFKHEGIWLLDKNLKLKTIVPVNGKNTLSRVGADIDGDGTSEFFDLHGSRVSITNVKGEELAGFDLPEEREARFVNRVDEYKGRIRLLISGDKGLYVYYL